MWSWWGPTWISVRCHGKRGWTSSPVGSAQTQRRAQMKPLATATPTPPCQVKTSPSDPQTDREAASMPAINRPLVSSQGWAFGLHVFLPLGPSAGPRPTFLASTAAHLVDDQSQAFAFACPSVLSPSVPVERWQSERVFPVLCGKAVCVCVRAHVSLDVRLSAY